MIHECVLVKEMTLRVRVFMTSDLKPSYQCCKAAEKAMIVLKI